MILLLVTALAASLETSTAKSGPFTATLSAAQIQKMGNDITCDVAITNNHDKDYYLLTRETPLENIPSHIFKIKGLSGSLVKYDGFLFKRGPLEEDKRVRIPAKSSVASTVVLSRAYNFNIPSVYSVRLNAELLYSKTPSSHLLRTQHLSTVPARFFLIDTGKSPKLTEPERLRRAEPREASNNPPKVNSKGYVEPEFHNNWPSDEKMFTQTAYSNAFDRVSASSSAVDTSPAKYTEWFGVPSTDCKAKVKNVFDSVSSAMATNIYKLYFYGHICGAEDNVYAYTWYQSKNIVLCKNYFKAGNSGYSSKVGTLIHELTHSAAHTRDARSGVLNALQVAQTDPDKATRNADNYEYFAESI